MVTQLAHCLTIVYVLWQAQVLLLQQRILTFDRVCNGDIKITKNTHVDASLVCLQLLGALLVDFNRLFLILTHIVEDLVVAQELT